MASLSAQLYSSKPSSHLHCSSLELFYPSHQQCWCYLINLSQISSLQSSPCYCNTLPSSPWISILVSYLFSLLLLLALHILFLKKESQCYSKDINLIIAFPSHPPMASCHTSDYNSVPHCGLWGPTGCGPSLPCSLCFSLTGFLSLPYHLQFFPISKPLLLGFPSAWNAHTSMWQASYYLGFH